MPAVPGDSLLTTLYADVHYYFSDPAAKPPHHRFDRGSYVYIYHNPTLHQAKLEIANHAGTPGQDAVAGFLHGASVQYSYKQPTLCTLRIDAYVQDQAQWRLPSYDERNEQRFLYQLHSLDIYLWTEKDAAAFVGHLKAVMPASRLDIKDAPSATSAAPAEHRDSMSPVVQQLEKTAIGTQFPPRAESTLSQHSFPGPPTPATSAGASTSAPVSPPHAAPTPMAYNPAAPAAPEPIAYREKTPPPPDDGTGTGLANATKYDTALQYASAPQGYQNSSQPTPQHAYFAGPPQQAPSFQGPPQASPPQSQRPTYAGSVPPPPSGGPSPGHQPQQQQQQQHVPSFAAPPTSQSAQPTSPPPHHQSFQRQSSFGGPPVTQYASYPSQTKTQYTSAPSNAPSFGPSAPASHGLPPQTPGFQSMQPPTPSDPPAYAMHTPLQSPGLPPPPSQAPPPHPQQPTVAGYSQYSYSAAQAVQPHNQYGSYAGDVHSQAYRPTAEEAAHGHHSPAQPTLPRTNSMVSTGSQGRGKLEERVDKYEKKVGGFLKKLDKLM